MEFTDIAKLIKSRRSLYPAQMDESKSITDEDIWKLLDLANYAPTHKLTEPWRFKVFAGKGVKDFYDELVRINAAWVSVDELRPKAEKLKKKAEVVSHVIALIMKRDPQKRIPIEEEEYAVACAVQNMLLAMESLNIIGYWGTGKAAFSDGMKRFLELGEEDKCMGFLQLGVPKILPPIETKRTPGDITEKVEWIRE